MLGLHVIEEGLFVESFSEVNVGGLEVELSLCADEELRFEVGRVEDLIENDGIFGINSHLLGSLEQLSNIRFLNWFLVLRLVAHKSIFVLLLSLFRSSWLVLFLSTLNKCYIFGNCSPMTICFF